MRKITFVFAFFTTILNAQNFPTPYCAIAESEEVSVEEISSINFNSVLITNTNFSDVLVDLTSNLIPVSPGQTYPLKVFGNTYGNFDTDIVAFIDWNSNGILDDSGEIYEVGTLTNSNGNDGVFVEMNILVPTTTSTGLKRVRITKTYTDEDSVAIINPCTISFDPFGLGEFPGYGQAIDFNLSVNNLSTPTFDARSLSIFPVPAKNSLTIAYKSAVGNIQIFNQLGQQVYVGKDLGSEEVLDVSRFATGVYLVKIFNENEASTFKFVKE